MKKQLKIALIKTQPNGFNSRKKELVITMLSYWEDGKFVKNLKLTDELAAKLKGKFIDV